MGVAPGDPGETIPASKTAPGPPNPPVKEVEKMVPAAVPMGRSTPEAPSGGAGLDAALSTEKAAEKVKEANEPSTGPEEAAPPTKDSEFSQKEIDSERKHIEAYPVSKDEAIAESVSKMVPWKDRIDPKKDVSKGPPPKKANATETNATETNATNASTVERFELQGM